LQGIRTARSRTSGENFVDLVMASFSQEFKPPPNPGRFSIKHRGKFKSLTKREQRLLKRRQSVEPVIGHLKSDYRMQRCHLKDTEGDALHAVLCATGFNIRWLLRMIRKKGIRLYLAPHKTARFVRTIGKNLSINQFDQLRRGQMTALAA
jgi:GTP cyclohydrolase II